MARGSRSHRGPCTTRRPCGPTLNAFDPRRFDVPPGQHPGGHRNAWFPFGAGPRACIGMQLATLEIQLVTATVLQAFDVTTPLLSAPVHAAITLLPSGELPITVVARK